MIFLDVEFLFKREGMNFKKFLRVIRDFCIGMGIRVILISSNDKQRVKDIGNIFPILDDIVDHSIICTCKKDAEDQLEDSNTNCIIIADDDYYKNMTLINYNSTIT
tara:strand:- start:7556 stop:7873 length:318 start_codon:yes stop_codon:yes gene_type:complete